MSVKINPFINFANKTAFLLTQLLEHSSHKFYLGLATSADFLRPLIRVDL